MYSTASLAKTDLQPTLLPSPPASVRNSWKPLLDGRLPHRLPYESALAIARAGDFPRPVGLRTPPEEDEDKPEEDYEAVMGTTYHLPKLASYDPVQLHSDYTPSSVCLNRPLSDAVYGPLGRTALLSLASHPNQDGLGATLQSREFQHQQQAHQSASQAYGTVTAASRQGSSSRLLTRPSTPTRAPLSANLLASRQAEQVTARRDLTMTMHNLVLPACISPNGGNLAHFAAEVTTMLWFDPLDTLKAAEAVHSLPAGAPVRALQPLSIANADYKKWMQSILSTTQVTQNVVLLALMFTYRLKLSNPVVHGRPGSEYRLTTVALMLGNKFLDDNTYTNKTWAEVSGIDVREIHVMEVEFLSNLRYSLLASREQWEEWLVKLANFREYLERAQRPPVSPTLQIPSATRHGFSIDCASPLHSPAVAMSASPLHPHQQIHLAAAHQQQQLSVPGMVPSLALQTAHGNQGMAAWGRDPYTPSRKRHFTDESFFEPAKRHKLDSLPVNSQLQHPQTQPQPPKLHQPVPSMPPVYSSDPRQPRLSVPILTINTQSAAPLPQAAPATSSYASHAPQQTSALSLPPLVPGTRAMSNVYSSSSLAPPGQSIAAITAAATTSVAPTSSFSSAVYGTPSRRLSPTRGALTPTSFAASSPLAESFSHHALTPHGPLSSGNGVHTPISHSPSIYLQQRSSPYKPVRHVNTLLYPPPSAFLQQYHFANPMPPAQMHYQPLGRRHDVRTGVVPEYALASVGHPYMAPHGGQHHAVTPASSQMMRERGQPQMLQLQPGIPHPTDASLHQYPSN